MLTIRVQKLPKRASKRLSQLDPDFLTDIAANTMAETVAETLRQQTRDFKCEDHPGQNSTIVVHALTSAKPRIDKSGMCCKKFADRVQISFS